MSPSSLVFLAHNGPTGLGGSPTDIWGCDFKTDGGDWGDPDLEEAIDGHGLMVAMFYVSCGPYASAHKAENVGIGAYICRWGLHVNAARVPRIFKEEGRRMHHHVAVTWDGIETRVEEHLVSLN